MSWLDFKHPEYEAGLPRWAYVRDVYSGRLVEPGAVTRYLIRKASAESEPAYQERCKLADYTPHFPAIVDSLAGMLFASEGDKSEKWTDETGAGLGSPADPTTPIGRLWKDVDGCGTSYPTLWKRLAAELVQTLTAWVLVDSIDGEPFVRLLPPECVPNWIEGPSSLTEALVVEQVDARGSLEDEPRTVTRYVRYQPTGWTRYERQPHQSTGAGGANAGAAGAVDTPTESGNYDYHDRRGQPALPIFRVTLPLSRPVGYLIARKAVAIFNKESERDHLLRYANFPRLLIETKGDPDAYGKITAALAAGADTLEGSEHTYISPDTGCATTSTEVLKRKVDELYVTAFREYSDAAQQKTATEIRQDVSAGVGAFLQLLKAAVDDAENETLWRVEQTLFTEPKRWFVAEVARSDKFLPSDINAEIDRLRKWAFGEQANLPIGFTAQLALAKEMAGFLGAQPKDAELESSVRLANLKNALDLLDSAGLPVPGEARAVLGLQLIEALGIPVTPAMKAEASRLAANEDEAKRQLADFRRGVPAEPTEDDPDNPAPMEPAA